MRCAVASATPVSSGTFLDSAAGDRLYALYHLIAYRGLRRGEAAGVEWEDVDLGGGVLTVRRQRVQLGWEVIEDAPKSEAGDRTVPLDGGTVAALRVHRRAQLAARLAWGPAWTDSGKVFTRENGEPLHPATLTDHFHELTVAAACRRCGCMICATARPLMLAAGVDLKVVQETLGHSSITITSDTYTSVYPEVAAAAAEAAAALVPRAAVVTVGC